MGSIRESGGTQAIIRWGLLIGIGLPVTAVIMCGLLSKEGYPELAAVVFTGYLGTILCCAAAHYRPKFIRAGVVFYLIFTFGIMLSYQAANGHFTINNSCSCPPGDTNVIEECF